MKILNTRIMLQTQAEFMKNIKLFQAWTTTFII
jgi:hypothetical protein